MSKSNRSGVVAHSAGATMEPLEPRALLAAISWDGGGGNSLWSNPLNWSLDFVPRQVDDVTIALGGPQRTIVADSGNLRVNSLALDETLVLNAGVTLGAVGAFNLGQDADLRINGTLNWAAGTWSSGNVVRINPGGLLNIGSSTFPGVGSVTLRSELDNAGRLAWRGGDIALGVDGSITNRPGKAMDFSSPGSMTASGRLVNNGLLRRGGQTGTTTTIDVAFETTDRLNILRGTMAIGEDAASPGAVVEGRVAALDETSVLSVRAAATHADGVEYLGRGSVEFIGGQQTFQGDARLAAATVEFVGGGGGSEVQVRVTGPSVIRGGFTADLAYFRVLAPTTLDGTFTLTGTTLTDTGIGSSPVLTFDGSVVANTVALAIDGRVVPGSLLQVGIASFTSGGMAVSGGYSLVNEGTVRYLAGTLVIGVDAELRNAATGTLVLMGPTVGGGPLSGPVVNLGTLVRENPDSPLFTSTTVITGGLDNQGTVDVREGVLNVTGAVVQLAAVPTAQDTVLTDGLWRVGNLATLDLPQPIEVVGAQATLDLIGLSNVPDLVGFLRENRGSILMSGNRPGISGPGPSIVNKGLLQLDGDLFSLQVFETAVEQRAAGRIIVKNGTLQVHGVSGATRNLANPGLIRVESGTLSLNLDEGSAQGTFFNTGTLDIRSGGQVTIDGAMSTSGTLVSQVTPVFRGHIVTTRHVAISGALRVNYVDGTYFNFHNASIIVPGSLSVSGTFASFTPLNVPSGFTPQLITQFGVSVRLQS